MTVLVQCHVDGRRVALVRVVVAQKVDAALRRVV